MNAVLDVHYDGDWANVACLHFAEWTDSVPAAAHFSQLEVPAEYRPGEFYLRELPCLLHALRQESMCFEALVVDGYVHLVPPINKGLGTHLAESLPYRTSVVGIAKNPFRLADRFLPVLRGRSHKPLFISAADMPVEKAAERVRSMHGEFRIPTLLRMTDRLSRSGPGPAADFGVPVH